MDKKICIVIPNYITRLIGGAELQVYLLAEELLARNWDVEIVSSFKNESDKNTNPQFKNSRINFRYYKQPQIISLSFLLIFWQLLKTRSSVYYVRTDYPHVGAVGLFCRLARKKMIYACADNECFFRNRYSRLFKPSDYKNTIKRTIRKFDLWFVDKCIEFGKNAARFVIAQTMEQKQLMDKTFAKNSLLIRNSFKNSVTEPPPKENIVLWVGNLRKIKQPELFVQLFQLVKPTQFKFVLIGEKNDEYESFPGISDPNFTYLGKLGLEETERWIARSQFIVNTSVSEGFSNTFIQAWFYRTYVLSLNADPENLFSKAQLGYCANGDFAELANTLSQFISEPDTLSNTLEKSYNFAVSEFDLSVNVSKFEQMLSVKK